MRLVRANYATIVAVSGGSCGLVTASTAAVNCQIPLTSQAGDVAIISLNGRAIAATTLSGMCGASFQLRGQPGGGPNIAGYSAENLSDCSQALQVVTGTHATTNQYGALAQVYRGAEITQVVVNSSAALPPGTGLVTAPYSVTIPRPGSVVATAWYLTPAPLVLQSPTVRVVFAIDVGTHLIAEEVVNQVGSYTPQVEFTGAQAHARWSMVLAPKELPPEVTGVTIHPTAVSITAGGQQQFTATVTATGDLPTDVIWTASPGTIDAFGLYTAPNVYVPTPGTVTATSVADPTQWASAVLNILPEEVIPTPIMADGGGGYRRKFVRSKARGAVWVRPGDVEAQ